MKLGNIQRRGCGYRLEITVGTVECADAKRNVSSDSFLDANFLKILKIFDNHIPKEIRNQIPIKQYETIRKSSLVTMSRQRGMWIESE